MYRTALLADAVVEITAACRVSGMVTTKISELYIDGTLFRDCTMLIDAYECVVIIDDSLRLSLLPDQISYLLSRIRSNLT